MTDTSKEALRRAAISQARAEEAQGRARAVCGGFAVSDDAATRESIAAERDAAVARAEN